MPLRRHVKETPKERRKKRSKDSAQSRKKDQMRKSYDDESPRPFKKMQRDAPIGGSPMEDNYKGFKVIVKCVTCPNCATSNCYEHIGESSTEGYCEYCSHEYTKPVGQKNAPKPSKAA